MNITWNKVLWFTAGALVGVAASYNYFKTKYERIAQEEIDSVKRAFSEPQQSEPVEGNTDDKGVAKPTSEEAVAYHDIISEHGYDTAGLSTDYKGKEVTGVSRPYVISPADFDTLDDYEVYSLTYYADGVLCDEQDNPIEDVESMVGRDSLNHFGEYEDDSVHVRNDALQCDYEILRDLRNYSDVFRNGPRPDDD